MNLRMIVPLMIGCITFSGSSFATETANQSIEKSEVKQSTHKKRRRKKALMCNECGKPEKECECEGHGEGEGHAEEVKHADD